MSKTKIEFDYNSTHYVLEHTAATLKKAEKLGLIQFGKIEEQILSAPENMFKSLFLKNHPMTSDALRHEIYNALSRRSDDADDVYDDDGELADELAEAVNAIINEAVKELSSRGERGNVGWKIVK